MSLKKEFEKKNLFHVQDLVLMAALIAMEIVLSRFLSFSVWNMKIGLAFIPVVVAAIVLGPVKAAIVNGIADFLGAILFPIGAYFPGFTLTAIMTGFVFGVFLYEKQTLPRIIGAVAVNQLIFSLLLNTLWISILYKTPYLPVLLSRLTQTAILIPIQIVLTIAANRAMASFQRIRPQKRA